MNVESFMELFTTIDSGIECRCAYCGNAFETWFGYIKQVDEDNDKGICHFCLEFTRILVEHNWDLTIKRFPYGFTDSRDKKSYRKMKYEEKKTFLTELMDKGIVLAQPQKEYYNYG